MFIKSNIDSELSACSYLLDWSIKKLKLRKVEGKTKI